MQFIDSFSRLPVGKYEELVRLSRRDDIDELEKQLRRLSILSGLPEAEILHLPIADYKAMVRRSAFLEGTYDTRPVAAKSYRLGPWELVPVTDARKLETCQYVDFQTFSADTDGNVAALLSVLLVPRGHRYNEGYEITEVQDAIREGLMMDTAAGVVAFFLTSSVKSIGDFLNLSEAEVKTLPDGERKEKMQKIITTLRGILNRNGAGLLQ